VVAPDEVLVAVRSCGICGSDVHGFDGSTGRRRPPLVMGHEAAGVVAEVGAAVSGWEPSARVTFDSRSAAARCAFLREGLSTSATRGACSASRARTTVGTERFAEYVARAGADPLPAAGRARLRAGGDGRDPRVGSTDRAVGVRTGETAVVVGTGMVGLLVVQALLARGCARVIGVDVDRGRLDVAAALGADVVLSESPEAVADAVLALTGGAEPTSRSRSSCVRAGGHCDRRRP